MSAITPNLQANCKPEEGSDVRKYTVGTILTFRSYDPVEVGHLGPDHKYTFKRGDKLVVSTHNACGMGIDAKRLCDGRVDMVWPNEVLVSRNQSLPKGFDLSSPKELCF